MEFIALLFGLLFLISIIMPWVNRARFKNMHTEMRKLQAEVRYLKSRLLDETRSTSDQEAKPTKENSHKKAKIPKQAPMRSSVPSSKSIISKTTLIQKAHDSFEKNIATKLPVWIGAISLICAAFFLVKYSMELGWLQPIVRISLGGLFGGSLIAAGQWVIRRDYIANYERIAQGLVGSGIVALYVSIYAAFNLYALLPPFMAFSSMFAVTTVGVILALRHGQPIAVFSLLGGLLTPALISSDEPNAIAMFSYLFLLFSGLFTILVRRNWWTLAIAAVVGVFVWSALWFTWMFDNADALVLVIFAVAITAVVVFVTGRKIVNDAIDEQHSWPIHGLNLTAIAGGALTIAWLSLKITMTLFDWSMLGLLSMAVMALAYFKPETYQKPLWVMMGANLILYYFWAQNIVLGDALAVIVGMSAVYIGGSAFLMRQVSDPRFWASIQALVGTLLFALSYLALEVAEPLGMLWGILGLIFASLTIYQISDILKSYHADKIIKEHLLAIYTLTASAFIAMGLAIELPWEYVPLAIAVQVSVTSLVYQKTHIDFLKNIAMILTLVFVGIHYEQILLFSGIILNSIAGYAPRLSLVNSYLIDAPFIKLGIPALLIGASLFSFAKHDACAKKLFNIVFGAALLFALITAYSVIRYSFHGDYAVAFSTRTGFIERGFITAVFALVGFGFLECSKRWNIGHLKPWALGLLCIAGLRYVYFDCFLLNPYFSHGQFVGDTPVFNGVTLTYGLASLLFAGAVYHSELISKKMLYKIISFGSLFAFVTFSVRQYFHGGRMSFGSVDSAELYAYSVVWLVTGLGLLTIGIQWKNKAARMASLAFILLAVCKVFLFDAANLEGLYRVFSFLGLGVSLIGLSYFYTRFISDDLVETKD